MVTTKEEKEIISKHMSKLGKKSAEANKHRTSEYYRWVRSFGKQKKV